MSSDAEQLKLGEAASRFLDTLTPEDRMMCRPDIDRFVRWFGSQRQIAGLTPAEIENFAEKPSQSDTEHLKRLQRVRAFLTAAKKAGWTKNNLATALKVRRPAPKRKNASKPAPTQSVSLTPEGYARLEAELASLKERRLRVIEDITRAAADKDFRENAPLHAAREEKGHIEGRILELEATLKSAVVTEAIANASDSPSITVGNTVILCDAITGEECRYTLVSPHEVDINRGRISSISPIGVAVIGKKEGETAEVAAPAGRIRYHIKRVE